VLELAAIPAEPARDRALRDAATRVSAALATGETHGAVSAFEDAASRAFESGADRVVLSAEPAEPGPTERADRLGLSPQREVLQLRRSLPLEQHATLPVRPFVAGQDDGAWLAVNNRAFAWHPDQSDWTAEKLAEKLAEPWFDPAGFLLYERDGQLAAFCWTKVHADASPPLGEIFVIAVDPAFHGHGLGRELTLAGLDWLAEQGLTVAMLYVEADNRPARRLYEDLGFTTHHAKRWWAREPSHERER
jgi:mycothiol synthase